MDVALPGTLLGLVVAAITGIGGLFVFVAKGTINNQLSESLERFRVRFTKLHERQAEVVEKLYSAIVELEDDATDLYYKYMPVGLDPPEVDEVEVIRRMRDLQREFKKSRIYLDEDVCDALQKVCDHLESGLRALERRRMAFNAGAGGSDEDVQEMEMRAFEEIRAAVPQAKSRLEAQFRKLLGAA